MDFLLSQPNESAGYIMEISPDSIITHLTAVSLVLLSLFLNSTGQVEGVRGICICLQFSCKQGVPYKEPQKHPVLRNAKPSDGLLGRGQIPHGTDCCVPYDGTGRSRLTPPDTAIYAPASRISSLCFCPFSGRIPAFFFVLRGLHRRGRGLTRTSGFKGLISKKGLTQGCAPGL